MYFFYILYSPSLDKFYIGTTADLSGRVRRHNSRHKGFTGQGNDWLWIYAEIYPNRSAALKRERYVKAQKSRIFLEKLTG